MFEYERIYDGLFTFEHDNGELRHFKHDFLQYGRINTMICKNYGRGITVEHKKNVKSLSDERKAAVLKYYFAKARQIRGPPYKSVPHKLPNSKQKTYFEFRNFILVPSQFSSGLCVVGANEQHVFRVNYGPIHIFMRKNKRAENEHVGSRIEGRYLKEFYHTVVCNQNMKLLQANEVYFVLTLNCSLFYFENAKGRSPLINMSYNDEFYDEDDDDNESECILPSPPPVASGSCASGVEPVSSNSFPPEAAPVSSNSFQQEAAPVSSNNSTFPPVSSNNSFPPEAAPVSFNNSTFPPVSSNSFQHPEAVPVSSNNNSTLPPVSSNSFQHPEAASTSTTVQSAVSSQQNSAVVSSQAASTVQSAVSSQPEQANNLLNVILQQPLEQQQMIFSQLQNLFKATEQQITFNADDLNNLFNFYQNNA